MGGPRYTLTADYRQKVCASVRDGVRPATASEAAGIPRQVMARWARAGRSPRALPKYRDFADALLRARGRAVVGHQARTLRDDPQEWGRDQRDRRKARRVSNPDGGMAQGENVHGVVNIFEVIALAKAALADTPGAVEALGRAMAKHAGPGLDAALFEAESVPQVPAGGGEKCAAGVQPAYSAPTVYPQPDYSAPTPGLHPDYSAPTADPQPVYSAPTAGLHPVTPKSVTVGDNEGPAVPISDTPAILDAPKQICAASGPEEAQAEAEDGDLAAPGDAGGAVAAHLAYGAPTSGLHPVTPEYGTIRDQKCQDATVGDDCDARDGGEKSCAAPAAAEGSAVFGSGDTATAGDEARAGGAHRVYIGSTSGLQPVTPESVSADGNASPAGGAQTAAGAGETATGGDRTGAAEVHAAHSAPTSGLHPVTSEYVTIGDNGVRSRQ